MRVLVACEESQAVTIEFRKLGHEAFSCDLLPCSGGHPEWHIEGDVTSLLHAWLGWDMVLAFPPCTYLTVTGNKWMKPEYRDRFPNRIKQREDAIRFFLKLVNTDVNKVCVENPIGIMSTHFRKPDQIIHPYHFGHTVRKSTCLWLKGLPVLKSTNVVIPELDTFSSGAVQSKWHTETGYIRDKKERSRVRSKTFSCIAKAMAEQWGMV